MGHSFISQKTGKRVSERTQVRTNGQTNESTQERPVLTFATNERTNEETTNKQTTERPNDRTNKQTNKRTNERTNARKFSPWQGVRLQLCVCSVVLHDSHVLFLVRTPSSHALEHALHSDHSPAAERQITELKTCQDRVEILRIFQCPILLLTGCLFTKLFKF